MTRYQSDLDIFEYIASLEEECTCNVVHMPCGACRERARLERQLGRALCAFRESHDLDWLAPSPYEEVAEFYSGRDHAN